MLVNEINGIINSAKFNCSYVDLYLCVTFLGHGYVGHVDWIGACEPTASGNRKAHRTPSHQLLKGPLFADAIILYIYSPMLLLIRENKLYCILVT